MNNYKNLEQIKEEVAKELGFYSWDLCLAGKDIFSITKVMNISAKRYATECVKASQEEIAKNAKVIAKNAATSPGFLHSYMVNKSSITDSKNIVLL